jgi:5'-AMP-activated protein kinase catalytic alpha subunit
MEQRQSVRQRQDIAKQDLPSAPRSGQQSFERTQLIGDDYVLLKDLGEGTFGNVKLGKHIQSGQLVAVKILEKNRITDQADVERVIREMKILKSIRHPNVIKLYEIIETKSNIYLMMEYASGGELFDYIVAKDRLSERESFKFYS